MKSLPLSISNKVHFTFIWLQAFPLKNHAFAQSCFETCETFFKNGETHSVSSEAKQKNNPNNPINSEPKCTEQVSPTYLSTEAKRQLG
jgi:hypothetical protein